MSEKILKSDPDFVWSFTDYGKQATIFDYLYDSTAIALWARDTLKQREIYDVDWFPSIPVLTLRTVIGKKTVEGGKKVDVYSEPIVMEGMFEKICTIYRRYYDEYDNGKPFNWKR